MAAVAAFLTWGIAPAYWKTLGQVGAAEIIAHRIVWAFAFMAALLLVHRRWAELRRAMGSWRGLGRLAVSAVCLTINWGTFVWAVNAGRVLDTSLGYYINPLVSILLGVVFLSERLRRLQLAALVIAAGGMLNLVVAKGAFPWIGLALAGSFGLYGLLRKTSDVESLPGLAAETALLSIPALGYLSFLYVGSAQGLWHWGWAINLKLLGAGAFTAMPLLLFSYGARRIPLSAVGFLQYLAPSCSFLLGVFIYHEPVDRWKLLTFALIWLALGVYSLDSVRQLGRSEKAFVEKPG